MTRGAHVRRVAAASVWAVSWAFAIASLAIAWRFDLPAEPLPGVFLSPAPVDMRSRFDDIGVAVALVYGPVSALILARRPHPVAVILAVHAIGSGLAAFGVQYGLLGAEVPGLPAWGLFAFAAGWGFVPGTFMTAALPLLVRRDRAPAWQLAVVVLTAVIAGSAFVLSLTQQSVPEPHNPFAIDVAAYQAVAPEIYTLLSFAAVAISVLSCGVLAVRWGRASSRARSGVAWLTLGHVFLTLSYLVLVLPDGLELPPGAIAFGMVAPVLGQVLYPAAILVTVLGQRLWGVELVVSRLVLWALLTASGVLLYLGLVAVLPAVLTGGLDGGLVLLAPVLIAIAAQPLRDWLQRRIDALVYGEGADPAVLLARLGDRIGELEPGAAGLAQVCEALRRALRLGEVAIASATTPALTAAAGSATGERVALTLVAGGRRIGELAARPRDGQRFDGRTRRLLGDLTGPVAATLQLVESQLVLEEARRELVVRRGAERRAIRRELHDGIGPSLAGVGFGLAAAENLLANGPGAARDDAQRDDAQRAEALLAELGDELTRRVRDVRSLADAVSPSPLEGALLADALADLARRFETAGRRIRVHVEGSRPLPRALEDAVYLVAAEALANAARHAGAHLVDLDVAVDDGAVVLRVADDGRGIDPGATRGIGLRSIRERAHELGGALAIDTGRSGTVVTARLPLEAAAAAPIEDARR
ncbi:sensor histidine kinase [Agromyces aurantiacus]|uniref:Sensor histidine kinase n=1 Tax=Agromyces aurantiacus TaxID=165814 RepID=A0ABV9R5X1_9MICO|nr:ATP-binding protein [Agromyces aurantiacus]MBM7503802.1 signal transduction histidine kinase [Agromyces aurantiacus]